MSDLRKGTLKCGFEYSIDIDIIENMRFIGLLGETEETPLAFPKALKMMFGAEQLNNLYDHLEANGMVPNIDTIGDILNEIAEHVHELKNS